MTQPSGLRNPTAAVRGVGAATLAIEALVLLLALVPLAKLGVDHAAAGIWLCLALVVVAVGLAGLLRRPWAWWGGLLVPLSLVVGGLFVSWALIVLGVLFGLVWAYVLNVRHTVLNGPGPTPPASDG
jgi:hypothetical protein